MSLLSPARAKGFAPIDEDEMTGLVVIYRATPDSRRRNLSKRHAWRTG